MTTSPAAALAVALGLTALVFVAALTAGLPLLGSTFTSGLTLVALFLFGRALVAFTGKLLRLLVLARAAVLLAVGLLLFVSTGAAWVGVVSALLLWLAADRLLGGCALRDLEWRTRGDY